MHPGHVHVFGFELAVWNAVLLVGIVIAYAVLRLTYRSTPGAAIASFVTVRYVVVVYFCTLGAQLFSYAFDTGGSLRPPPGTAWASYYLNPIAGSKTLYGSIVFMPAAVALAFVPWRDFSLRRVLDRWTPAMLTLLGIARLGCFAQGCCYGIESHLFGIRFVPGSAIYLRQVRLGRIADGAAALPTVPTQAMEALFLLGLGVWAWARLRRAQPHVFVHTLLGYSAFRFAIELVREDPDRNYYGPLATSQWIAATIIGACIVAAAYKTAASRRTLHFIGPAR